MLFFLFFYGYDIYFVFMMVFIHNRRLYGNCAGVKMVFLRDVGIIQEMNLEIKSLYVWY